MKSSTLKNTGVRSAVIIIAAGTLMLTSAACESNDGNSRPVTVTPPRYVVDSPEWEGAGDDDIVATVDGSGIPAWRVKQALADAPPGTDPMEIIYALISEELIARRAAGKDGFVPEPHVFEKTIASRFIEKKIIEDFGPEDVPSEMLQEMFTVPQVWSKFNHFDLYDVQDYQWICCPDPKNCDPESAQVCFDRGEAPMAAVYEKLIRDRPDPQDLTILAPEFKKIADHLSYQEYSFAFDKNAGFQKGLTHVDKPVAKKVMELKEGEYTRPVRSRFGWHIARLKNHHPERHGDLTDQAIRLEIAQAFIQRFRQETFLRLLASLVGKDSLKLLQAYYKDRPAPDIEPTYDVQIFRDRLRQATGQEAAEKAAEPI